jgi:hypothetical protein
LKIGSGEWGNREAPYWSAIREIYLQDLVEQAFDEAERFGGRESNDLFAEAWVRREGQTWQLRDWLTVEALPTEIPPDFDEALASIQTNCEELSVLYGWDNREATMITFLPRAVEASWMPGRWGYFVDKVPYDKICLPHHLMANHSQLREGIRHEFMHAITLNLSNGHDPRWLAEAMATLAEGRVNARSWNYFRENPSDWLNPARLTGRVGSDQRNEDTIESIVVAYDQCSFLALYLYSLGGEKKLRETVLAISNESVVHNLRLQLLGRNRTDNALRRVYGVSEQGLFDKTLQWVRDNPVAKPAY